MRKWLTALSLVLVVCAALAAQENPYPERWVLGFGASLAEKETTEEFIQVIKTAGELGYTHVIYDEVYNQMLWAMPPKFFEHVEMVRKAADEAGVIIVPGVFNVGYSWRVLWNDSNLAAGLPVEDAPFDVAGGIAQ